MIKFMAIALLACVCMTRAEVPDADLLEEDSQSALNPTDSEEVANLMGKHQIFSDFCLQTRDYVREDVKRTSNNKAADVFTLFFRSAEDLGVESLNTQKDATERLSEQLRNPETQVSDANDAVEEGRRRIQDSGDNVPKSFFQAMTSALTATGTTVAQGVKARLMAIRSKIGPDSAISILTETCSKVEQYEEEMRSRFAKEIETVASKDPSMANVQLDQVECLTSKRILKIEGLCRFARIAKQPLMKIMTYRS